MKKPRVAPAISSAVATLVACLSIASTSRAAIPNASDFPSIDFEGLGSVSISGAFDGISIWTPQQAASTFDSNTSSLLLRDASGALTKIDATNPGGKIDCICQISIAPKTVYVGGIFNQIAGQNASNIAAYDPTSRQWTYLNGGLDGPVNSLFCDDNHGLIYAGGSFVRPANVSSTTDTSRYLGAVATWNFTSNAWLPAPFGGVNGAVNDIAVGVNSSTLRFTGAFDTAFTSTPAGQPISGTNSSASPLSITWAPLPLGQAEFQGGPSNDSVLFNNPAQILCPQGLDGANNTYLFADNTAARLTMRTFRELPVRGIRLANTFIDGRGTNQFSVLSIPDNVALELLYLDPPTQKNVTCTSNCPLFHDPAIPYQDFLITDNPMNGLTNGVKLMTGIQLTVNTWFGSGAGLHMFQLLSDGGYAFAYDAYNRAQCNSLQPGARNVNSNSTSTGAWFNTNAPTNIAGTVQPVLALTDDFSNLGNHLSAQVTWNVDVNYDGNYSVYLKTPGCTATNQCGQRTVVQARVINNITTQMTPGNWTRIPQNNTDDSSVLIYRGGIQKASSTFYPSVQLTIPSDAPAPTFGNTFTVVADSVSLSIINSNETYQSFQQKGIGLLEYDVYDINVNNNSLAYGANLILSNTSIIAVLANNSQSAFINSTLQGAGFNMSSILNGTVVNGTTVVQQSAQAYIAQITSNLLSANGPLPNTTMTNLDYFSGTLAYNGVRRNDSEYVVGSVVVGNMTYVSGNFVSDGFTNTTGFMNVVSFDAAGGGQTYTRLANGGLNGEVGTLVAKDTYLYMGGNFTATADNSTALSFIARYDTVKNTWSNLGGGTDNAVKTMAFMGNQLLVSGLFTSYNGSTQSGGFAIWDTVTEKWDNSSTSVVGALSAVFATPDGTYIAGQVASIGSTAAAAAVNLSSPDVQGQFPKINIFNFQFPSPITGGTKLVPDGAKAAPNARRSLTIPPPDLQSRSVFSDDFALEERSEEESDESLIARFASQSITGPQSLNKRQAAITPDAASLTSTSPNEILTSGFWRRADGVYLNIFGGNFTTSTGVRNLAIYDPGTRLLSSFPPLPASSNVTIIRSLYVDGSTLYAGGDGGIVVFDLKTARWINIPNLTAPDGTNLTISAIAHRPSSDSIIVAGNFAQAGGLPCMSVCLWDSKASRWMNLGNGIVGQITSIDFAGSKANTLIVAGSILFDGFTSALASWNFDQKGAIWTALGTTGLGTGQAPGPATAVSVDNFNTNAIYVAGRSSANTYPFLLKWDGTTFENLGSYELLSTTGIAQLTFVGLNTPHVGNNVMESNRMLVVSGALNMRTYGNVSSALFDGQFWTPFLLSTQPGGGPGVVRTFARSIEILRFGNHHILAVGIVILISIAIGLGVVFLLVLLGLIWALLFRRKSNSPVDNQQVNRSDDTLAAAGVAGEKKRPSSLLATLNAATENVMNGGAAAGGGGDYYDKEGEGAGAVATGAAVAGVAGVGAAAATSHGHGTHDYHDGPPESSMGHGGVAAAAGTVENSDESGMGPQSSQYHSDGRSGLSHYYSSYEGAAVGAAGAGASSAEDGTGQALGGPEDEVEVLDGIEAHARYTFEATHPSELGVRAGEKIWILDDQDEHWWLARNESGQTGVLPSTYVL